MYSFIFALYRLLVGSPRDGDRNLNGDKQGMIYKCRLVHRLPLNQVCTPFLGNTYLTSVGLHVYMCLCHKLYTYHHICKG